jgi:hypothetical protein
LPRKRGALLPRVSLAAKIVGRVGGGGICGPKRSPPRADVLLFSPLAKERESDDG